MNRALGAFVLVVAVVAAHLATGGATAADVLAVVQGHPTGLDARLLWEYGLPRLLTAALTGSALGVAGYLLQSVLRNPLAAPELTAVNPGAVLGVLGGTVLGAVAADAAAGSLLAALVGGALGGGLSWALAAGGGPGRVVVAGLLGSAVLGGLTTMLLAYQPSRFGNVLRWLAGSVEGRVWDHLTVASWWIPLWLAVAWAASAAVGVLQGGDEHAASLGLPPRTGRAAVLAVALALTAGAAALAGAISFVGLVVPHAARWLARGEPRACVPVAALVGAAALTGADALAQAATHLLAAGHLGHRLGVPTGVVTALLGAAVLVAVVRRERPA
ncbi:iron ABC transporter permease [Actinomadura hibisca]|uniref:iron ABC transporter permease n=1 Tax=Actinomadura hibisca TaxID=68565 RepID=UPI0008297115|nr:iron ABC transporter permease [Actinomadura hibisca]